MGYLTRISWGHSQTHCYIILLVRLQSSPSPSPPPPKLLHIRSVSDLVWHACFSVFWLYLILFLIPFHLLLSCQRAGSRWLTEKLHLKQRNRICTQLYLSTPPCPQDYVMPHLMLIRNEKWLFSVKWNATRTTILSYFNCESLTLDPISDLLCSFLWVCRYKKEIIFEFENMFSRRKTPWRWWPVDFIINIIFGLNKWFPAVDYSADLCNQRKFLLPAFIIKIEQETKCQKHVCHTYLTLIFIMSLVLTVRKIDLHEKNRMSVGSRFTYMLKLRK